MKTYKSIKGIKDILPGQIPVWHHIESTAKSHFESFAFSEIRVPIIEYTELFARGIGAATDIVEKEMYTFQDRDGKMITLRPEGTAGAVRAYLEHYIYKREQISRLYYLGPMFRHERPQKGRLRQFYQIGAESIGNDNPLLDAEIIYMIYTLFQKLKIPEFTVEINSLGCSSCRGDYRSKLVDFFTEEEEEEEEERSEKKNDGLCTTCKKRLEINPLRILDCKNDTCKEIANDAPTTLEHVCDSCKSHHSTITSTLDSLKVPYVNNTKIVRGLDYYTRTAFEFTSNMLGSQNAIAAGGRYDGLIEELGGPSKPGVGFAMGVERLVMLLEGKEIAQKKKKLFIAALGQKARDYILPLSFELRSKGVTTGIEYEDKSLKALMKKADQFGADWTILIGEDEIAKESAIIRNMHTKKQLPLLLPSTVGDIEKILNS